MASSLLRSTNLFIPLSTNYGEIFSLLATLDQVLFMLHTYSEGSCHIHKNQGHSLSQADPHCRISSAAAIWRRV